MFKHDSSPKTPVKTFKQTCVTPRGKEKLCSLCGLTVDPARSHPIVFKGGLTAAAKCMSEVLEMPVTAFMTNIICRTCFNKGEKIQKNKNALIKQFEQTEKTLSARYGQNRCKRLSAPTTPSARKKLPLSTVNTDIGHKRLSLQSESTECIPLAVSQPDECVKKKSVTFGTQTLRIHDRVPQMSVETQTDLDEWVSNLN